MRLGIDSYSLRWQGWDAFQLLEYSAGLGLDNVHFSERRNFASLEPDYLLSLKARADALGVQVEVGMGSFDRFSASFRPELGSGEEQLSQMLRAAAIVNSPVVRCYLGTQLDRRGAIPLRQHMDECVRTLTAVAPLARDLGIKVAVENHGGVDLLARELLEIVQAVGPDAVGVCLDTGNPAYGGEDPVVSAEVLAPFTVSSHVRDTRIWQTEDGAMAQWAPLGQGNVDLPRIIQILSEQAPNPPVDLEIITGGPPQPLPYLDVGSGFWDAFPDMLARDFARFVALARRGKAEPLDQLLGPRGAEPLPADQLAALRAQQRRDFEASVRYAQDVLGLGERSRG
ncbi:MAG TPA: sugar phosphate isomerase/epimerase family protein [Chloroflexota bacterium]|nr:sugar phosphate isomerase/epimerase family protein [Chloroflexota bacterium]